MLSGISAHGSSAILVTGGSGLLGRHLVRQLATQGETVVSMYRHKLPEPMGNVYPVCSDMSSSELIAAPLRGIDTVVHLAWEGGIAGPTQPVDWSFKNGNYTPNLKATLSLVTAMERAKTKRIIFVSCLGASRNARSLFAREKYLAEFFILNSKIPEKIIIRSDLIASHQEDRLKQSVLSLMNYVVYPVPHASKKLNPVNVDDFSHFIGNILKHELKDSSAIADFRGSEDLSLSDVFSMVKRSFLKKTKIPIKGYLADQLFPWFEKTKTTQSRFSDILSFERNIDECLPIENPLNMKVPHFRTSYQETLESESSRKLVAPASLEHTNVA